MSDWRPRVGAGTTAVVAVAALMGWALGVRELLTWGGDPAIKDGTVLALMACAVTVLLLGRSSARGHRVARLLCVVVAVWATLVIVEWCVGRSLGADALLSGGGGPQSFGGRTSPHTAAGLVLLSGALFTLDASARRWRITHVLLLTALLASTALIGTGWLFGAPSLTGEGEMTGVALPTLTALTALLGATLTLRPAQPPLSWARGASPAAMLVRRLAPAAILVPVLLGALRPTEERAGLDDDRFEIALFATSMMVLFLLLVLATARTVDQRGREGRELRARLEALLDHMPGAVHLCDTDGRLQAVNRAFADALGLPAEALIGRTLAEVRGPGTAVSAAATDELLAERDALVVYEQEGVDAEGGTTHSVVTKYPVRGDGGTLIGVGSITADITARVVAEQALVRAEQRLRDMLDAAPDAMVVVDLEGLIQSVNAQGERLFGYAQAELVGRPVELLIPQQHRGEHSRHRAAFAAAPALRPMGADLALRARRRDGSECPVEISLSPLDTDDGTRVIAAIRDVTQRARDEAEQDALRRVATAVAEDVGAAAVFQLVADEVAAVLEVENGIVVRFESQQDGTILGLRTTNGTEVCDRHVDLRVEGVVALVARTGEPARVDGQPRSGSAEGDGGIDSLARQSGVAAPIRVGGRLWGALAAATSTPARLPQDCERRVERFAHLLATAISNAQAWERLERQAATDAVTGLPNYRAFHARLRAELERSRRHGRPLGVVLFDVDRFKRVNDTYGHHAGDAVLAELGRRLAAEVREGEIVARVGGEEFAWLLPETDGPGAMAAAERARQAVQARAFDPVGSITVSAGVCGLEDCGEGDLLRMADRALYMAKDAGRNRACRYSEAAHAARSATSGDAARPRTLSSIRALARAIDAKDLSTRRHSERVAQLSERLALGMGWTTKQAQQLHAAALLHDVGKIGIPDSILLKPGRLTAGEYEQVMRHAAIGAQIVSEVLEEEPTRWVRHHHEHWDGSGYPDGLAADGIPDGAQLLALADAWDVMTTNRSYKDTRSVQEAQEECTRQRGRQFAPDAVDALLELSPEELGAGAPLPDAQR